MKMMSEESNQSVSHLDLFNRTHRREKGKRQFVDKILESVSDKYKLLLDEKYGSDTASQPDYDARSWCEVTRAPIKGCLYGFGEGVDDKQTRISSGATSSPCVPSTQMYTKEEVDKMMQEMRHQMLQEVQCQMREELRNEMR